MTSDRDTLREARDPHATTPMLVWADVDLGIAPMVEYLNTIPGVRTEASCQGTIGEGGPNPYRSQVMTCWPPEAEARLLAEFDVTSLGRNWGYLHPREGWTPPGRASTAEALIPLSEVEEVLGRLVIGYGRDHTSKFCRDQALALLSKLKAIRGEVERG